MRLFLDCDGVLADFETRAVEILGMHPRSFEKRCGLPAFWRELARDPDFYASLPLMPGARRLFDAVRHLDPVILTGCPRGGWAEAQKVRWAAEHFPGTRIITCMAVDKRRHGRRGDVLVDDTLKHRHLWEAMGGTFVHHRDVEMTLAALPGLGLDVGDRSPSGPGGRGANEPLHLRQSVDLKGTLAAQKRLFHAYPLGSLEEESIMAQDNQQGGSQPNQNPGQQEQQDGQRQNQQGQNPGQGGGQQEQQDGQRQNQQGQNPGQGGGQQEQQDQQRRQPGQDNDQNNQGNQAGRDDENRQGR